MSSLNSSSSLGSGREGDGRNAVDTEKRTSITMLVLGDGEFWFFSFAIVLSNGEKYGGRESKSDFIRK